MGTLVNSEEAEEMPHKAAISSGSALFAKIKCHSYTFRAEAGGYLGCCYVHTTP